MTQYVRVFKTSEEMEVIISVSSIWKIEVMYAKPDSTDPLALHKVSLKQGSEDPDAIRMYKVFVGGDDYLFAGENTDPAMKVFEEIYRSAVKAPG